MLANYRFDKVAIDFFCTYCIFFSKQFFNVTSARKKQDCCGNLNMATLSVENVEKHTNNLGQKRLNAVGDADNLSTRSSKQTPGILSKGNSEILKKKDGDNKTDRKKSLAGLLGM